MKDLTKPEVPQTFGDVTTALAPGGVFAGRVVSLDAAGHIEIAYPGSPISVREAHRIDAS